MSLPSPILYDPSVHQHLLYQFAQIHIDSIVNDELDSNIPPPFKETSEGDPDARVVRYWLQRSREVEEDARFIVMQLLPDDEEVLGFVSFHMNRGDGAYHGIEKLLVKFEHRRQGIARRLMAALEEEAKRRDYRFLHLNVRVGSPAEIVYRKLGYTRLELDRSKSASSGRFAVYSKTLKD